MLIAKHNIQMKTLCKIIIQKTLTKMESTQLVYRTSLTRLRHSKRIDTACQFQKPSVNYAS